jgi:retron-type reverse transcriptase
MALARVAGNRGRRTAGVDGITVGNVTKRAEAFIAALRWKFRPLGIPTVKDRLASARRPLFAIRHGEPGA